MDLRGQLFAASAAACALGGGVLAAVGVRPLGWVLGGLAALSVLAALATFCRQPGVLLRGRMARLAEGAPNEWDNEWDGLPGWAASDWVGLEQALASLLEQQRQEIDEAQVEKSRLAGMLESITEGILVTAADGRILLANHALGELFGVEGPLAGKPTVEVVRHSALEAGIKRAWKEGGEVQVEFSINVGGERHLDVHLAPIRGRQACIGVVAVFHDITQLRRLERMRKDFVANVSHEMRTPLTAIKGCAETLADGALEDDEAARRFVQVINSHADRLARLLDDLLDLARLESEELAPDRSAFLLQRLAEACISAVGQEARRKRIDVACDAPADLKVTGDRKLLENALINLLDNAVKYTPEGGTVRLQLRPSDGPPAGADGPRRRVDIATLKRNKALRRVTVEVADTGIGIPSQDLERIFERFFRVDKGRSRAMGGTGLGLSIVRHIIEAHGERLYVESELNHGTTIGFTLPVEEA